MHFELGNKNLFLYQSNTKKINKTNQPPQIVRNRFSQKVSVETIIEIEESGMNKIPPSVNCFQKRSSFGLCRPKIQ